MYAYAYTLNYKTGVVREYKGKLIKQYQYKLRFDEYGDDDERTGKYLTGLSLSPETVRGQSIWFTEPNMDKAIEAFRKAGKRMVTEYGHKQIRSKLWTESI